MNLVILYGRLTKDPELRYSQNGTASCFTNVAVNRAMSKEKRQEAEAAGQPTADFIGIKASGKTAEMLANYFHKGNRIAVEGRISTGSYEKNGERVYTTDVIVNRVHFVETAAENGGGGNNGGAGSGGFAPQDNNAGYYPIDNADVPF
ncbi:MAG: single-stranded DNA-binding protein [Aedoeadaptatus pacaensis]